MLDFTSKFLKKLNKASEDNQRLIVEIEKLKQDVVALASYIKSFPVSMPDRVAEIVETVVVPPAAPQPPTWNDVNFYRDSIVAINIYNQKPYRILTPPNAQNLVLIADDKWTRSYCWIRDLKLEWK